MQDGSFKALCFLWSNWSGNSFITSALGCGENEEYRLRLSVMALIIEIRLGLSNCPRQNAICNLFQNLRVLYKVGRKKSKLAETGCVLNVSGVVFSDLIIFQKKQQN